VKRGATGLVELLKAVEHPLASMRPRVQTPVPPKTKTQNKNKKT
jgi:hypothetical protein